MLKRTLIVVAVVALLATSAQALGPDPTTGTTNNRDTTGIKVDIQPMEIGWPFEYKALNLCVIPVYMHVGYFVQVEKCWERKIKLVQVECEDPVMGKAANDFPCYYDCEDVKIRANFEVKLGLSKARIGDVLDPDRWSAAFQGSDIVDASGGWNTITVCVKAWRARLYGHSPGTEVQVGTVTITVKPTV
jgi:hypothetical protein